MNSTVLVSTLDVGDKFMLVSPAEVNGGVYVIYDMSADGWAECVEINSGKDFSFGRAVEVIPVEVTLKVRNALRIDKSVDLTNKCGSCAHASTECKELYKNQKSYVRCMNPNRSFRHKYSAYRPRTTKCCQMYKAKETENAT